ncbi:hypothetical protein [Tolypothrix sp. VBCCA 56010]|uniref:hypothetical protein n=1 Tax=Tolypothrix sp. VBCCA 56010 TaxID=3137731 RepID=UPI003D7D085B
MSTLVYPEVYIALVVFLNQYALGHKKRLFSFSDVSYIVIHDLQYGKLGNIP